MNDFIESPTPNRRLVASAVVQGPNQAEKICIILCLASNYVSQLIVTLTEFCYWAGSGKWRKWLLFQHMQNRKLRLRGNKNMHFLPSVLQYTASSNDRGMFTLMRPLVCKHIFGDTLRHSPYTAEDYRSKWSISWIQVRQAERATFQKTLTTDLLTVLVCDNMW